MLSALRALQLCEERTADRELQEVEREAPMQMRFLDDAPRIETLMAGNCALPAQETQFKNALQMQWRKLQALMLTGDIAEWRQEECGTREAAMNILWDNACIRPERRSCRDGSFLRSAHQRPRSAGADGIYSDSIHVTSCPNTVSLTYIYK